MSRPSPRRAPVLDVRAFVAQRSGDWQALDSLLGERSTLDGLSGTEIHRVATLHRALCADLVRARHGRLPLDQLDHLERLAARAHTCLYRSRPYRVGALASLLLRDFPRTFRASGRFMAIAAVAFLGPAIVMLVATLRDPSIATVVLPQQQLDFTAQMYMEGFEQGRAAGVDATMTGFYVNNNIGIAFRCFATGIFGGLGSLFFLVLNGVYLGATIGWLADKPAALANLLTFVAGHGALELTAIVIAGGAGLRMGYALIDAGSQTRLESLRQQGPALARLVAGAAVMLGAAALIEGFWSPSSVPEPIKWTVAAGLWLAVFAYLGLAGRSGGPR